jgi:hypothetical protein
MELTIVGVSAAKALRGTMDMTAVAPANAAVRRMKVRRCIGFPGIALFGGFMFVLTACCDVSSGGSAKLTDDAKGTVTLSSLPPKLNYSLLVFSRPAVPFQSIFARMTLNPIVQTSQVCPPLKRNTRSGGITLLNRSIPGSKRSASP